MKLEIDRMLTCCTSHVTVQDTKHLDDPSDMLVSYPYEYGWIVFAGDNEMHENLSKEANALLALARKHGCEWLRLDQAGDTIEGFEVFEW